MTGSARRRLPVVALLSANIISQNVRTTDPVMVRLLTKVETGHPIRIALVEGQSAGGLRTTISRSAGNRGISVATVAGEGFVGVKKVDQPRRPKSRQPAPGPGQGRPGRPRKQDGEPLEVILRAADNQRIVPELVIES
jgi:hypothetical protein